MSVTNGNQSSDLPLYPSQATHVFSPATAAPNLAPDAAQADVLREMAEDWNRGTRTPAEEWLNRYPQLAANPEIAVQIVYEEICLREDRGEEVLSDEIFARFPQWCGAMRMLIDCHRVIHSEYPAPRFPHEGERLGDLQLVKTLGRGAVGQVFLARQPSLSDRPLVVKLTPRVGDEHLSLARLQHTHIVPLYHVLDFPKQHLRALCMPYLGGVTWAQVLSTFRGQSLDQRSGRAIVSALDAAEGELPAATNRTGPALGFLLRSTYTQAVCWFGACVADALHHAHECGLIHLDIKPSNILLAGDGQPMLLDFHLAREVMPVHGQPPNRLGGTHGYMAPEHTLAAAAVSEGRPLPVAVDRRADIYALGATLYESLTGQLPPLDEAASRRHWRQCRPAGGSGLEDIIHKCLARNPDDRYSDAARLATDLRRHLTDLPLSGVPNRSLRERWQKWRRRKPHALAAVAAALVVVAVTLGAFSFLGSNQVSRGRSALEQSRQSIDNRDFVTAVEQLEGGLRSIRWMPGQGELRQALEAQLVVANRGRVAHAVHQLVEQLRFLDSYDVVPVGQLRQLDAACEKLWKARERLAPLVASASGTRARAELCEDLTDVVISWAALRLKRDSSAQLEQSRRDAQRLFDEAESLCGSSFALDLARLQYASDRSADVASTLPLEAHTASDHYAMGRNLFRLSRFGEATDEFKRAREIEPDKFWPYFYLTLCASRLEDFDRALHTADVCIALSAQSAVCFYNRALCHQMLGHAAESLNDLTRAIQLDPALSIAWLRRGMLNRDLHQYAAANDDFRRALEHTANPAEVYHQMALVEVVQGNIAPALAHLQRALQYDADYPAAVALKERLESRP